MLEQLAKLAARKRELLIRSEAHRRMLRQDVEPVRALASSVDAGLQVCRSALGSWREVLSAWRGGGGRDREAVAVAPVIPDARPKDWMNTVLLGVKAGRLVMDVWKLFRRL